MITAVDTSVLLDVLADDPRFGPRSLAALRAARAGGALVASAVVWAELRPFFRDASTLELVLDEAEIGFDPIDRATAYLAGEVFGEYRRRGGSRSRIIPDFLVGAHARICCGRLLTRDRGFFRRYFRGLEVIEPSPGG